jgi:c-di-GMP-binding flagellar brake protein YcgR
MVSTDPDEPTKSQRQERRQYARTRVVVEIELLTEGATVPLWVNTADLSLGGLYVEMMFTLALGTKLNVLWINGTKLITEGVVVTRDLQVGNGIKFADMAPKDLSKLERFLTARQ